MAINSATALPCPAIRSPWGRFHEDSGATGIDGNGSDNTAPESGAVYVFIRNGAAWSQQAYIKASNTEQ